MNNANKLCRTSRIIHKKKEFSILKIKEKEYDLDYCLQKMHQETISMDPEEQLEEQPGELKLAQRVQSKERRQE